jgi:hypothetical protein
MHRIQGGRRIHPPHLPLAETLLNRALRLVLRLASL